MIKYRYIYIPVIFFLLATFFWRFSLLLTNSANLFASIINPSEVNGPEASLSEGVLNIYESGFYTDYIVPDHHETIEEAISRIKRDVVVTGTITGSPGQESAVFQIEGMVDREFNINAQLMDGFIIADITENQVTLKNQNGEESFSLRVQSSQHSPNVYGLGRTPTMPDYHMVEQVVDEETNTVLEFSSSYADVTALGYTYDTNLEHEIQTEPTYAEKEEPEYFFENNTNTIPALEHTETVVTTLEE